MPLERAPVELPPWLVADSPRASLRDEFVRARWLLATHWLLTTSGAIALLATFMIQEGSGTTNFPFLVTLTSLVGVPLGALLGLQRVRTWVVQVVIHSASFFTILLLIDTSSLMASTIIMGLWSVGCGHLALQRRLALGALWIPTLYWLGAIVTVLERSGSLHTWEAGDKAGIWNPLALGMLTVMMVETLAFLAGQEHYHSQVWLAGAHTTPVTQTRRRAPNATRVTKRGVFTVLVFSALMAMASAKIAPYLWRTGPQDGDRSARSEPRAAPRQPDWRAFQRALQQLFERAREHTLAVLPFLPLFFLHRPLRRAWRSRHWRRALYPVSPSEQASNSWRYVTLALGDVAHAAKTHETHEETLTRLLHTHPTRGRAPPEGLAEAHALYERIRFGLGIPVGSLEALQAEAERAFVSVRAPLTPWQRIASWWRTIDP